MSQEHLLQTPLTAIADFVSVLNRLEIQYLIGGSFASSLQGEFRTTNDIDFVCSISLKKLPDFKVLLEDKFIVDPDLIDQSMDLGQAFNIFHEDTFTKIDVFTRLSSFERGQLARAKDVVIEGLSMPIKVASAEDIILAKLVWYKKGQLLSERQWNDILGVIKIQKDRLDNEYLKTQAEHLEVRNLLDKAFALCD